MSRIEKPVDRGMVNQAIEMSALRGLIKSWPKGIDEQLGTEFGGRELSKGERQKAAVARVFYRNAPLTILDEPTAAVDSDSVMTIFEAVERMSADKSAVLIFHNFATIRRATRVLVLEGGKLIESGTHDELMQKGGAYARSFRTQAEQFS